MSRPYLYHYAAALGKSHALAMAITRKELDATGFDLHSTPLAWEQVALNADTIVVATCVPLSSSKTYVHVSAASNTDASAKKWAADIMKRIKESKMVLID